jgi:hypothetical protein
MKLVICGCAKNCDKYIENSIIKLLELKKIFEKIEFIIFENNSTDNTVNIIKKYPEIHLLQKNIVGNNNRIKILAYGRNELISYIFKNFNNFDLILMTDLDFVLYNFDYTYIQKSLNMYDWNSWDVLTANQLGPYYDIYALRTNSNKIWDESLLEDCWKLINKNKEKKSYKELLNKYVKKYQKTINENEELIPVISAFGGMGLYKMNKIENCVYNGDETCEHVEFHKQIIEKNNGKIFICPKMITTSEEIHIIK